MTVFRRALEGHSRIFDFTPFSKMVTLLDEEHGVNCLLPVNIAVQLRKGSKVVSLRLGDVHHTLFPDNLMEMHRADNDVLATTAIFRCLLK